MEKLIATIRKNASEEIRVALSEFTVNGTTHQTFAARVFFDDGAGNYRFRPSLLFYGGVQNRRPELPPCGKLRPRCASPG